MSDWMQQAACRDHNPDLFFPGRGDKAADAIATAKTICTACPVRHECLEDALERNTDYGVWGGLTRDERRSLRRRHKPLPRCGTQAGMSVHAARSEQPCRPCVQAYLAARYQARRRKATA